jgi:TonB family protein
MNTLLIYMIKAAFYMAALYIVYSLLLSKDTLYGRNRFFILLSVITALLLPFITLQTARPVNLPYFGKTLSEVLVTGATDQSVAGSGFTISGLPQVLLIIYTGGIILFGIKLLIDLAELSLLILRKKGSSNHIITFHGLNTPGFSALGYIFLNDRLSPLETEEILKHEQNHLDQNHFIDIMLIESVKVFQWFNPFIHLFDRSLRAVHEFQADEECLRKGITVVNYQRLLMNQIFKTKVFTVTNSFSNPTLIKKRMIMMTKKRSRTLANLKLLMVLPAIAIVLIAFSSCAGKTENKTTTESVSPPPPPPPPDQANSNKKVMMGEAPAPGEVPPPPPPTPAYTVSNGDTTWYKVDVMPEFPGGETALIKYIGKSVQYPPDAKEKGIQGRVIISFVVETTGKVQNVHVLKGVNPSLDKEAIRVVSALPDFTKAGLKNGKPVPVWYMLPINFALK